MREVLFCYSHFIVNKKTEAERLEPACVLTAHGAEGRIDLTESHSRDRKATSFNNGVKLKNKMELHSTTVAITSSIWNLKLCLIGFREKDKLSGQCPSSWAVSPDAVTTRSNSDSHGS